MQEKKYVAIFRMFSNDTSIRILRLLWTRKEEVCVCEFSTAINRPVYEISKRLRLLKKFGFVAARREGK